jgi:hypothetical protein
MYVIIEIIPFRISDNTAGVGCHVPPRRDLKQPILPGWINLVSSELRKDAVAISCNSIFLIEEIPKRLFSFYMNSESVNGYIFNRSTG